MKTIHRLFTTFGAVAVMGGVLSAPTAQAQVFPGSLCIRVGSGGTASYTNDGRLFNSGTTNMTIVCPIVRDATTTPWNSIAVALTDQNLSLNASCRGISNSRDGLTNRQTDLVSTTGNSSTNQIIGIPTIAEEDNGYYALRCGIPPVGAAQSGINSYRLSEQ